MEEYGKIEQVAESGGKTAIWDDFVAQISSNRDVLAAILTARLKARHLSRTP